jgi:hypothetical protein
MASTSIFPPVSEMAELRSNGSGVPILFPIDAASIVVISCFHLSIRFSLQASAIWVEREIFHPDIGLLVHTFHETSKVTDNGIVVWELAARRYRVCGWPDSHLGESTKILAPLRSSTADFSTSPVINVKTEPGLDDVIDLSDFSNDDVSLQKVVFHDSPLFFPSVSFVTPSPSPSVPSTPTVPSTSELPQPIVNVFVVLVLYLVVRMSLRN